MARTLGAAGQRVVRTVYRHAVRRKGREPPLPAEKTAAGPEVGGCDDIGLSQPQGVPPLDRQAISHFFKDVTAAAPNAKADMRSACRLFPKLVAEVSGTADGQAVATGDVDVLLRAFRDKTAPVMPRSDVLAEAHKVYLDAGELERAQQLLDDMEAVYGVQPLLISLERQAAGYLHRGKDIRRAYKMLKPLKGLTAVGQHTYNWILRMLLAQDQAELAWEVFGELQGKTVPSGEVASTMLTHLGRTDKVEQAFLLHKRLTSAGMPSNAPCFEALIYAASKRKDYFPDAIDLFRQMVLLKMPIGTRVYNHLLQACGKVADLSTAMSLWKSVLDSTDPSVKPTVYTCTSYLWALSAVETPDTKISNRDFVYKVPKLELVKAADEVVQYMADNGIQMSPHTTSALLALYSNLRMGERAEQLFWEMIPARGFERSPFAYEFMFKLYDNTRNYDGAAKVHAQALVENIKVPYEGWRALIRCAALCDKLDDSIGHIREMRKQGYRPTISDLTTVLLRIHERERYDLEAEFKKLCKHDKQHAPNPHLPWLRRSQAVGELLKDTYGRGAPQMVSKVHHVDKDK